MKNFKHIYTLLVMALVGLSLAACSNDDLDTNQYKGGFSLNAYGPNPVMRGGTLRFVVATSTRLPASRFLVFRLSPTTTWSSLVFPARFAWKYPRMVLRKAMSP
jgi:hypothetical protein